MNTTVLLIQSIVAQKRAWREKIAASYDDKRNYNSIALLDNLLREPDSGVSTAALDGLSESELRRACNDACHKIGFRVFPAHLSDLINIIVELAAKNRSEIDSVFGGVK